MFKVSGPLNLCLQRVFNLVQGTLNRLVFRGFGRSTFLAYLLEFMHLNFLVFSGNAHLTLFVLGGAVFHVVP